MFRIAIDVNTISNQLDQNMSRGNFSILLSALLFVLVTGSQAMARTESFRQTCVDIHVTATWHGQLITAQCAPPASPCPFLTSCFRSTNATQLLVPPDGCEDISNRDGTLICVHASSLLVPGGSWSESCRSGRFIQGSIFDALCKNQVGAYELSRIDIATCPKNRLQNTYGRLRCE